MNNRRLSSAEATVLDALLPPGLTEEMRDVAYCLFEALALQDARTGTVAPDDAWLFVLRSMAHAAVVQLQHLAREKGGQAIYLAKGVAAFLTARDREMCSKFRGDNYKRLASEYGLTEMRVRQIVDAWQREQFLRRQGRLPGLGDDVGDDDTSVIS